MCLHVQVAKKLRGCDTRTNFAEDGTFIPVPAKVCPTASRKQSDAVVTASSAKPVSLGRVQPLQRRDSNASSTSLSSSGSRRSCHTAEGSDSCFTFNETHTAGNPMELLIAQATAELEPCVAQPVASSSAVQHFFMVERLQSYKNYLKTVTSLRERVAILAR